MNKPTKYNNLIIIGLFLISASSADDMLNKMINDEYENISNRTAIDYNTKVVQTWHDSVWVNKTKKVKTYDDNGYLSQKDSYKYRDDQWSLRGMTVFENNDNGDPETTTRQA